MKKYSLRYWISKFLMLLIVILALLPVGAVMSLYFDNERVKHGKMIGALAELKEILNQLSRKKFDNIKFKDHEKILLSEVLAFIPRHEFLREGKLYLIQNADSGGIYLVLSDQDGEALFSSYQAYYMDRKSDDGLPYSGKMTIVPRDECVVKTQINYVYSKLEDKLCAVIYFELSGVEK